MPSVVRSPQSIANICQRIERIKRIDVVVELARLITIHGPQSTVHSKIKSNMQSKLCHYDKTEKRCGRRCDATLSA
jgi:hypothetical protein